MSITHVYAGDIVKTETTEDGDLLVYGKATGPDLDLDEQRCDPDWLKNAMPGWAQWANIREQHSAIAAGVGVETVQDGDDWYVKSLVVDAGSAKKVEKGVLKGYSIGIKNARVVKDATAPGGRIVGGDIVEISLVDRPCNPTATMAIAKSADGELAPVDVAGELVMDLSKAVIVDQQPAAVPRPYLKAALETVAPQLRAEIEKALAAEQPAFDRDAAVATVAEVLAGTRGPVELNKAAASYDESADIAGALAVIKQIAQLICSEAESLGEGRLEEAWDIGCLMDAVRSMSYFLACERAQDSGAAEDIVYVGLDAEPDEAKTADGVTTGKGATIDQTFEKDAVTLVKALAASKERIEALEADLAKAKAQPAAGGPAIMRVDSVAPATAKKTGPTAEYYRRQAELVPDAQARSGYLQLAKQAAADAAEGQ
jgi:hypothetical protein